MTGLPPSDPTPATPAMRPAPAGGGRARRSRTVLAVVLVTLGVLLAPVGVATGWAAWTLTDTDRFVATYAPLSRSPDVRAYVVEQVMAAVDDRADLEGLTRQLLDGLVALGTGPRTTEALRDLQGTVAIGLRSVLREGTIDFVDSDQFDAAWAETLRQGHGQLIATLRNDPAALVSLSEDGSVGLPLAPIVERIKTSLVDRGVTVADRIPTVDRTIVLVRSDQLPAVQRAYALTVAVGTWLPWAVLLLLVGGVAAAHRRHRALLWAAGGVTVVMAVLATGFGVGRLALLAAVPTDVLPSSVAVLFYDTATRPMSSTAVAAAVLGAAVVLVGWLSGPFRTPKRLRAAYAVAIDRARGAAEERGLSTGRIGILVHRGRRVLLGATAVLAGLSVVTRSPLSVAQVGWSAFWATVAVVVVTLVERPGTPAATAAAPEPGSSTEPASEPVDTPAPRP